LNHNIKELPLKMKAIPDALTPAAAEGFKGKWIGINLLSRNFLNHKDSKA
jgi:hypothetical protein